MNGFYHFILKAFFLTSITSFPFQGYASNEQSNAPEKIEILDLDIIPYEAFNQNDPTSLEQLEKALYEKGIVGIKGIPGYKEKVQLFIETARAFSALPEEIKDKYAPDHAKGDMFLGYEKGKEQFQRPDGKWVVDDLKVSYYAYVPENSDNKWPIEIDLQTPFEQLGGMMSETGEAIMKKIGLIGKPTGIYVDDVPKVGRMLYYRKSIEGSNDNPFWCGSHFDHGIFTTLLPAFYFVNGQQVPEPIEAGLFVKTTSDGVFKKVIANDPDVMMFQVGEFGQLVTNDGIRATEHRVHKATGSVERYTLVLFFDPPMDAKVYSTSELITDARYGNPLDGCTYRHWHEESFKRYIVK